MTRDGDRPPRGPDRDAPLAAAAPRPPRARARRRRLRYAHAQRRGRRHDELAAPRGGVGLLPGAAALPRHAVAGRKVHRGDPEPRGPRAPDREADPRQEDPDRGEARAHATPEQPAHPPTRVGQRHASGRQRRDAPLHCAGRPRATVALDGRGRGRRHAQVPGREVATSGVHGLPGQRRELAARRSGSHPAVAVDAGSERPGRAQGQHPQRESLRRGPAPLWIARLGRGPSWRSARRLGRETRREPGVPDGARRSRRTLRGDRALGPGRRAGDPLRRLRPDPRDDLRLPARGAGTARALRVRPRGHGARRARVVPPRVRRRRDHPVQARRSPAGRALPVGSTRDPRPGHRVRRARRSHLTSAARTRQPDPEHRPPGAARHRSIEQRRRRPDLLRARHPQASAHQALRRLPGGREGVPRRGDAVHPVRGPRRSRDSGLPDPASARRGPPSPPSSCPTVALGRGTSGAGIRSPSSSRAAVSR